MNEHANPSLEQGRAYNRRRVLRGGGLVAGAALLAVPSFGRAAATDGDEEIYDVALDGRTFRLVRANQADPNALPTIGDTFVMYGSIFPAGTFDRGDLNPDQPDAIGRWICCGTINADLATTAVPHAITTVQHILGDGLSVGEGAVAEAPDVIVHEGLEGGVPLLRRSIIGGYGKSASARGEATQELRGQNETLARMTPAVAAPMASFTFTFKFAK